ncbi:MAG: hypothetical protein ABIN24_06000, partial [Dyadobacter sp.]
MKRQLFAFSIVLLASGLWSCRDKCKETRVVIKYTPIIHPAAEIRNGVKILASQEIQDPGKMYSKDNYLFINDIRNGIHIIDNHDPSNPVKISFIQIPGNGDFVIQSNTLYADSYSDVVSFDISDLTNIKVTGRVNDLFEAGWFNNTSWSVESGGFNLSETTKEYVTETVYVDCENDPEPESIPLETSIVTRRGLKTLSRFAIQDKFLYSATDFTTVEIFNLMNFTKPDPLNTIKVSPLPLSIFTHQDKLFISSFDGFIVYDNSTPDFPKKISAFPQGTSCDKTVIQNNIAYLITTIGSYCGNEAKKLDLIDISDSSLPKLIKSYPMISTSGLALDYPTIYICEGTNGFKVFDVSDKMTVDQHLLTYTNDLKANDVILSGKIVIVNAEDGIYQFDGTDPKNLKQLSKI